MTDTWFIFDNESNFLFKTSNIERTINIPSIYNATHVVKNPRGYDSSKYQLFSYDIVSNSVIFRLNTIENIVSTEEPTVIVDSSDILAETIANKSLIVQLTSIIETLTSRIDVMETQLNNTSTVLREVFPF